MLPTIQGVAYDYGVEKRYSPIYRKTQTQLTVALPGGGCKFWLQTKGRGCTFCGFPGLTRLVVKGEGQEENFEGWLIEEPIFIEMFETALAEIESFEKLAIFNGGSFFIDTEIPRNVRGAIYKQVARDPRVRQLMVESRPEYLTEDNLSEARCVLDSGKDLMVGIGVESVNERVRNKLLRKGMNLTHIKSSIKLMKKMGVQVFAYAFLKAPGLSEREALDDATDTIRFLTDLEVDEIALSCAFVQANTPLEQQYHAGKFRPPWLWTVLELIDRAEENGWPLSVGGFDDNPTPIAISQNCGTCDAQAMAMIDCYRKNGYLAGRSLRQCECIETWNGEVETPLPV